MTQRNSTPKFEAKQGNPRRGPLRQAGLDAEADRLARKVIAMTDAEIEAYIKTHDLEHLTSPELIDEAVAKAMSAATALWKDGDPRSDILRAAGIGGEATNTDGLGRSIPRSGRDS